MSNNYRAIETVFLDRDGVINRKMPEGKYVTSCKDLVVLPDVPAGIRRMNEAGLRIIVVSNQRGIALRLCTRRDVDLIHDRLRELLAAAGSRIDGIYICEHNAGECDCRKPEIGLFRQACADFPSIRAESSVMVGDSVSDIEFGNRAGMRTIFIEGDPDTQKAGAELGRSRAGVVCASFSEAVDAVLHVLKPAH